MKSMKFAFFYFFNIGFLFFVLGFYIYFIISMAAMFYMWYVMKKQAQHLHSRKVLSRVKEITKNIEFIKTTPFYEEDKEKNQFFYNYYWLYDEDHVKKIMLKFYKNPKISYTEDLGLLEKYKPKNNK